VNAQGKNQPGQFSPAVVTGLKENEMRKTLLVPAFVAILAATATARDAAAQGLTIGGGLGAVLNERRDLPTTFDDVSHKMAFVSLRLPLVPLEIRGEGLWPDDPTNSDPRAYIASAVLAIPIVIVTPYAQAGWGDYNFGDPDRSKWSAGIGARLNLGNLGIFAEATRYNRMNTDLITGGLTISFGKH
jgi:hypothetical protein